MLLARDAFSTTTGTSSRLKTIVASTLGCAVPHRCGPPIRYRLRHGRSRFRSEGVRPFGNVRAFRDPRRARATPDVGPHAVGQDRRAHRSVRCREHAAHRRRESMHDAESGVGQRQSAHEARHSHIGSRFRVAAVFIGAFQRTCGTTDSFQAVEIGHGIGAGRRRRARSTA